MSEIERYNGATPATPATTDSWVDVLGPVSELAAQIAGTEFVPDSLRGKPAAVAAAILTGREMGIGPMVALSHIHVIKGKPGQSAQLMRALVLSEGHHIHDVETTDTRCIVEGRRKDEQEWTRVTFTADQARKAKIDLGGYPEDKLYARATSRLCRRKFADVVAGMPYTTDELEDVDEGQEPAGQTTATKRRTAQRKTRQASGGEQSGTVTKANRAQAQSAPQATVPEPPLPGEDDIVVDQTEGGDPVTATVEEPGHEIHESATPKQLPKALALFNDLEVTDRDQRLHYTSAIVGAHVSSFNELTKRQANTLIDTLERVNASDDPAGNLAVLVENVAGAEWADEAATDEGAAEA